MSRPSRTLVFRRSLWSFALTACLCACGATDDADKGAEGPAADGTAADAAASDTAPPTSPPADASFAGGDDAASGADALAPCSDDACGEGAFCEEGVCHPAAALVEPTIDDVFRVSVARFDIAPAFFETYAERASPECPRNRPGAYDGPLVTTPTPADPCADAFDDVDGDGRFDALWMAGAGADRAAAGVDEENPPSGRVLLLQRNEELWLLVTLDLYAIGHEPLRALTRGLSLRTGLRERRIAVHTSGVRNAPDAVGMWGPTLALAEGPLAELQALAEGLPLLNYVPIETGLDQAWWDEVRRRVAVATQQALTTLQPASFRAARVPLPEAPPAEAPPPGEDPLVFSATSMELTTHLAVPTWLSHDQRFPIQRDLNVRVAAFTTLEGTPLALLGIWGASPAASSGDGRLNADVTGLARAGLEAAYPGAVALWLTGASSEEVLAGAGSFVPETDALGQPTDDGGTPASAPAASLGRLLAQAAYRALEASPPALAPTLQVTSRFSWLPITNPRYDLAARLGVVQGLTDWLAGRRTTPIWSSGVATPACGGLGCLRYRLDRVDLGPVTLLTTPAGLDQALVMGRLESTLSLTDPESRNLTDLDLDGIVDADDPEIVFVPSDGSQTDPVRLDAPLNPQRFDAVEGLESDVLWLLGRTNGGLGSLLTASDVVNVYEGQMEPLERLLAERAHLGLLDLCLTGYDCDQTIPLADLLAQVRADLPSILANLPGGHLLELTGDVGPDALAAPYFRVEAVDGTLRVEGQGLELGPGPWAFALSLDFGAAAVLAGDVIVLPTGERHPIARIAPVSLSRHPNAGDQWRGLHAGGGDAIYNAACELIFGGTCPHPRAIPLERNPDATLPRTPDEASPPSASPAARRGP